MGELRRAQGKTQREIGEALGVTNKTVSLWELGKDEPHLTPFQMLRMMELYGCETLEELAMAVAASLKQAKD